MTCGIDSGNVSCLLSVLTGVTEAKIEKLLMSGITPWALADSFGKLNEFKDIIDGTIEMQLDNMVHEGTITRAVATEMMINFKDEHIS
ncbi:MAG: hypothetical protein RSB38_00910 [Oscillospiraceae bacterium]